MAVAVSVFTFHGNIITLEVAPGTLLRSIKDKVMESTPMDVSPLSINADWAEVMRSSSCDGFGRDLTMHF